MQIEGELHAIESEPELAELVRQGRVSSATPIYDLASAPRSLEDLPDLAHLSLEPVMSEPPPVRQEHRSRERALFSEELAILNRPLEDDVEYYDEVPPRRWPKRLGSALVLAAALAGAYPLVASRLGGWRAFATMKLMGAAHAEEKTDAPRKIEGSALARAPIAAAAPPPPAAAPASRQQSPAGDLAARASEDAAPELDALGTAAVEDPTAGSHRRSGPGMEHRTSRSRGRSRH